MPATPPETAGREDQSLVVAVAPVRSGRGLPMPLRVLGVAIVVGVIGFLAGNHVGGGPAAGLPEPTAAPSHSSAPPSPPSAAAATSRAWRGLSDFAFTFAFRPERLIAALPDGAACVTRSGAVPGHIGSGAGRSLVVVWLSTCPTPPSGRAPFLGQLLGALGREIPNARANTSRDDHGISVTDFGYTQGVSTGSVTVVADSAGRDLVISITLEEPVAQ
jgi:hypothetical protein